MKTPILRSSSCRWRCWPASLVCRRKKEFNVCWTIYAGWMPWGTISNEKIIDKWASKYGIKINIVQLNDYIESINQYTAGQFDGCTMTNMDALTIPAAGALIPRR
jgi:NitT/TauT family transport system substrate-binding protein